jgi:mRNA (guanine-N7-)-methyltransferase
MPAFDPVRDAVLNSPISPSQALKSPGYPRLDISASLPTNFTATSSPLSSPSVGRRATDLSVLLNSHSQEPTIRTPPPTRSSTLSHLLHSDNLDDRLQGAQPLRRPSKQRSDVTEDPVFHSGRTSPQPSSISRKSLSNQVQQLFHQSVAGPSSYVQPAEVPAVLSPVFSSASRPSSSSSNPSTQFNATPRTTSSPVMPPPPSSSSIPYNPRKRITPAGSVLIPMSPAEMEMYKNYCGTGTQRLTKRKRARSTEPNEEQPPAKKLAGDVGVVVDHYNARPDVGVVQRLDSPIIGLKNFNNWVKSVLITRFAHPVLAASPVSHLHSGRGKRNGSGKVLDMGCGKGGDLTKWAKAKVREVIGVGRLMPNNIQPPVIYMWPRYRCGVSRSGSGSMGVSAGPAFRRNIRGTGLLF